LHRSRRATISLFFSKRLVSNLKLVITKLAERLYLRLSSYTEIGLPIVLNNTFSYFAIDIITEYAFARSYDFL
ncbi:uncharacterized protein A1O9_10599, partial [Exophiala aquamarina CBS 119918]